MNGAGHDTPIRHAKNTSNSCLRILEASGTVVRLDGDEGGL